MSPLRLYLGMVNLTSLWMPEPILSQICLLLSEKIEIRL